MHIKKQLPDNPVSLQPQFQVDEVAHQLIVTIFSCLICVKQWLSQPILTFTCSGLYIKRNFLMNWSFLRTATDN